MRTHRTILCGALLGGSLAVIFAGEAAAVVLITESEAALPINKSTVRGISRGPKILVISPSPGAGLIRSPLNLRVRFESFGGAAIDVGSVVVTYERYPAIDLTQRVIPFVKAGGIEMPGAEVPVGTHRIRFEVKDSDGRTGTADFTFRVTR